MPVGESKCRYGRSDVPFGEWSDGVLQASSRSACILFVASAPDERVCFRCGLESDERPATLPTPLMARLHPSQKLHRRKPDMEMR